MENKNQVAIVVGRFQVDELTVGHERLMETAIKESDKVIIFVGDTKGSIRTEHDPLPYEARKWMIENWYKFSKNDITECKCMDEIDIFRIEDLGNYPKWVEMLDRKIEILMELEIIPKDTKILIYGSRDSVAEKYKENGGKYEVRLVEKLDLCSGTDRRKWIYDNFSPEWNRYNRELAIYMMKGK